MNSPPVAEEEQLALEARAVAMRDQVAAGAVPPDTAFGSPGEWELEIGGYHLLLFPGSGQWLVWDAIGESWLPTGVKMGEGRFCVSAGELCYRATRGADPSRLASSRARFCGHCGAPAPPDEKFCGSCGASHGAAS